MGKSKSLQVCLVQEWLCTVEERWWRASARNQERRWLAENKVERLKIFHSCDFFFVKWLTKLITCRVKLGTCLDPNPTLYFFSFIWMHSPCVIDLISWMHLLQSVDFSFDVIILTETWNTAGDTVKILRNYENYNLCQKSKRGGGVPACIKNTIHGSMINEFWELPRTMKFWHRRTRMPFLSSVSPSLWQHVLFSRISG